MRIVGAAFWSVLFVFLFDGQSVSPQESPNSANLLSTPQQACPDYASEIVKNLSIEYPPEAQTSQIQGSAQIEVSINLDGTLANERTISGPETFSKSVVRATNKWAKYPIIQAGLKQPVTLRIDTEFKIDFESPDATPFPAIAKIEDTVITLERSGCYGSCPAYRLRVHGNGVVEYEGLSYVFLLGKHRGRIPNDQFKQLLEDFRNADYFSLRKEYVYRRPTEIFVRALGCTNRIQWYSGMTTDLPSTRTSIAIDGAKREVFDYDGAPPALRQLETRIDQLSNSDRWLVGNAATVPGLRAEGYDVNTKVANGWTPILGASEYSKASVVRNLIFAGANVNTADAEGITPLMFATLSGLPDMTEELLRVGADSNAKDRYGRSVLMYACSGGNEAVVAKLLSGGLDVNAKSRDGDTALMAAAAIGNPRIVKIILSVKPRVNNSWPQWHNCFDCRCDGRT
jgi:TonB family protein